MTERTLVFLSTVVAVVLGSGWVAVVIDIVSSKAGARSKARTLRALLRALRFSLRRWRVGTEGLSCSWLLYLPLEEERKPPGDHSRHFRFRNGVGMKRGLSWRLRRERRTM